MMTEMSYNIFAAGDRVRDLVYPARPGGVVLSVTAQAVLVWMSFEDGHQGLSHFSMASARRELGLAPD